LLAGAADQCAFIRAFVSEHIGTGKTYTNMNEAVKACAAELPELESLEYVYFQPNQTQKERLIATFK